MRLGVPVARFPIAGEHGRAIHRGEREFGHLQLVVERAALQASQCQRSQDPHTAEPATGFQDPHIDQAIVQPAAQGRRETRREIDRITQKEQ
ncbi:Uncharacterised protein [Mycobacteroides abscessus subsp. abscessus]|nr:Uncharacterised protein [Mycobacteroides abscessus subsp. abscessus]